MAVSDYSALINASAAKYGVDPALVAAVITAESAGNPNATSPTGAQGLMQLEPGTAAALGVTNAYDPAQNIDAGTRYLAQQLASFNGNVTLALAAYNAGPGAVDAAGGVPNIPETQAYVQTVLGYWQKLGGGTVSGALQSVTTAAPSAPAATSSSSSSSTTPTPGFFGPVIDAANNIATEVFAGALALALLSGGLVWLASTDSNLRDAAVKAAAVA